MQAVQPDYATIAIVVLPVLLVISIITVVLKQYKRCPSNALLVVYGKVAGQKSAKVLHGGGTLVVPLIQDFGYLSLKPIAIDIQLQGALSKNNIRVNVPSIFTVGISKNPELMNNAAERLLGQSNAQIADAAKDIIFGQLRLSIASMSIEEINQDRDTFLELINKNVNEELARIGLTIINVNITDITDESGYIEAIGQKAAAEAINRAKIEVAEQEKTGAIGEASAHREREVSVAEQRAQSEMGVKKADSDQRVKVAEYDTQAVSGEKEAEAQKRIRVQELETQAVSGEKEADTQKRIRVQELEAQAIEKENLSKANIADYNADLEVAQAESLRRGQVAEAESRQAIYEAEKKEEVAKLEKTEVAQKEIDKRKAVIDAEAEADVTRQIAAGEADAILLKFTAEAEGIQKVLDAKAEGYRHLVESCGSTHAAATMIMTEKLETLVEKQAEAISNLQIDKITVWDTGDGSGSGGGSTSNFLKSMGQILPPMHELAKQAGILMPELLGKIDESKNPESKEQKPKAETKES